MQTVINIDGTIYWGLVHDGDPNELIDGLTKGEIGTLTLEYGSAINRDGTENDSAGFLFLGEESMKRASIVIYGGGKSPITIKI